MTVELQTPPAVEPRADRSRRIGAALVAGGVLAVVLSFLAAGIPIVALLNGTAGWLVGLALVGAGVTWLVAPGRAAFAWRWFRAFRRTRPFWGGLYLLAGGWLVLRLSMVTVHIVVISGLTGLGGWLTGAGMVLCGLAAWAAPSQRYVVGIVGMLLALTSLVVSNLGGLFVGMLCGLVGGAMTLAWGPKRARRSTPVTQPDPAAERAVSRPSPRPRPTPAGRGAGHDR